MTNRVQTMLSLLAAAALLLLPGCKADPPASPQLRAPYAERQVWAVAPLRNESGSMQVDGAAVADHLARQLENAHPLDVLPVNRVIAAMDALKMPEVASPRDAANLRRMLQADALVVGSVTAYDPYDPPGIGMAVELYLDPEGRTSAQGFDPRELTRASTDNLSGSPAAIHGEQPVSVVSGFYSAADPDVREALRRYAAPRSQAASERQEDADSWHRYRSSMDLYTQFASYLVSQRLLEAETARLQPQSLTTTSAD